MKRHIPNLILLLAFVTVILLISISSTVSGNISRQNCMINDLRVYPAPDETPGSFHRSGETIQPAPETTRGMTPAQIHPGEMKRISITHTLSPIDMVVIPESFQ